MAKISAAASTARTMALGLTWLGETRSASKFAPPLALAVIASTMAQATEL
jgi:hypothetical protein